MTEQVSNANSQAPLTDEQRDAASAAKYRSQLDGQVEDLSEEDQSAAPPASAKPERPANVPEKFWDAEKGEVRMDEVLKAHSELEKKLSQKPAAPKPAAASGTENGENVEGDPPSGEQPDPVAEARKEFTSLRESTGAKVVAGEALSDDDYAGFEKHGYSREEVDDYIDAQKARATLARMEVHNAVGGEGEYTSMIAWARANFDSKEIEVYDRDIHSGDPAVRLTAAKGLAARYAQANGTNGDSVTDTNHGSKAGNGYASGAEMRADMRDPRYSKDEAFRAQVARKVQAARAAGIDLSM